MAPETTAEKLSPAKVITGDKEFFSATSIKSNFLCRLGYAADDGFFERAHRYNFDEIAEIL